jgi:N-acetylmuramoyl-L-alanine amidase
VTRWSGAQWRPISCNWSAGTAEPNRLLITHVIQGPLSAADSWFRNPAAGASAHFGIGSDGTCYQWIDTDHMSWANCDANGCSVTVETAGFSGQPWSAQQIDRLARLLHWAHGQYPSISMWLNVRPQGSGLSYHGLGGAAWCGHPACPGSPRVHQLGQVLDRAKAL